MVKTEALTSLPASPNIGPPQEGNNSFNYSPSSPLSLLPQLINQETLFQSNNPETQTYTNSPNLTELIDFACLPQVEILLETANPLYPADLKQTWEKYFSQPLEIMTIYALVISQLEINFQRQQREILFVPCSLVVLNLIEQHYQLAKQEKKPLGQIINLIKKEAFAEIQARLDLYTKPLDSEKEEKQTPQSKNPLLRLCQSLWQTFKNDWQMIVKSI